MGLLAKVRLKVRVSNLKSSADIRGTRNWHYSCYVEGEQKKSTQTFLSLEAISYRPEHGLRTPREEIAFTARPKVQSQSQIFSYGGSIFCLPHRPNLSDIFDLCLHWVSVVRAQIDQKYM